MIVVSDRVKFTYQYRVDLGPKLFSGRRLHHITMNDILWILRCFINENNSRLLSVQNVYTKLVVLIPVLMKINYCNFMSSEFEYSVITSCSLCKHRKQYQDITITPHHIEFMARGLNTSVIASTLSCDNTLWQGYWNYGQLLTACQLSGSIWDAPPTYMTVILSK